MDCRIRTSALRQVQQLQRQHTLHQLTSLAIDTSPFQYGGLVPLVAIYKINYPAYYSTRNRHNRHRLKQCKRAGKRRVFPKVPDQHKVGQPLIPNGLGVLYVLFTTVYLFLLYFLKIAGNSSNVSAPFTLSCMHSFRRLHGFA